MARTARAWVAADRDPQQFSYEDRFPRPTNAQGNLGVTQPTRSGQPLKVLSFRNMTLQPLQAKSSHERSRLHSRRD
jgi:hypothetical protein